MSYFTAQNLKQNFDTINIDVSFECEKGTMTSIVGPSGSGKSTVLRLIAGLNKPDAAGTVPHQASPQVAATTQHDAAPDSPGTAITQAAASTHAATDSAVQRLVLDGKDITNLPPQKREIGMVFQSHTLFNHLRVDDNVAYGLVSKGMKKSEARAKAAEFLKSFDLEGFEKRWPETLSGGEAQRVSLARTLITKPKLVLFDEPLSALDAPLRKKLAALIHQLQQEIGFTGIMVTHDINEAKSVSDRIILMKKGKIFWDGSAEDFDEKLLEIQTV